MPVDLQVICATHCDLDALVSAGRFRLDRYYRLNGLLLTLQPRRERADNAALVEAILADEASSSAGIEPRLSASAHALLLGYHWPRNIRQLRNALGAALALCDGGQIDDEHLPAELSASSRPVLPPHRLS